MDFRESIRLAWRSIQGHRLRSALTTLGIVIGVAAAILFVTLGMSLQTAIVQEITGDRAPELTVTVAPQDGGIVAAARGGTPVFTDHDVNRLRSMPGVAAVYTHSSTTVSATPPSQTIVFSGRVPPDTARLLPPPTGRTVHFGPRRVLIMLSGDGTVPATAEGHVTTRATSEGVNATIVANITPIRSQNTEGDNRYSRLTVEADSYQQLPTVRKRVTRYLQTESDAQANKPDSSEFLILSNKQIVGQVNDIVGTLTTYIVGVALLSWIVGSIGIINIMLMSVTERTRSIGIMKAVGARNRDILQLFLVEAIILGGIGAALGTGVGVLGGAIATELLGLPLVFHLQWAGFAILSGIAVGIIAGVYPAWRAARTDPIEALRFR